MNRASAPAQSHSAPSVAALLVSKAATIDAPPAPPSTEMRVAVMRGVGVRPSHLPRNAHEVGALAHASEEGEVSINRWHFYDDGSVAFGSNPRMLLGYLFAAHANTMNTMNAKLDVMFSRVSQLTDRVRSLEEHFEAISAGVYTPAGVSPTPTVFIPRGRK